MTKSVLLRVIINIMLFLLMKMINEGKDFDTEYITYVHIPFNIIHCRHNRVLGKIAFDVLTYRQWLNFAAAKSPSGLPGNFISAVTSLTGS